MKANVGIYDQGTRILLAIAIAVLYYFNVIDGIGALIVAGVLVVTSLFGFCPLYKLLHISTEEKHSST